MVTSNFKNEFTIHPSLKASATLNTSASFKKAELIRIGNGYLSNNRGNFTTASHCTPSLIDLKPTTQNVIKVNKYRLFWLKKKLPVKRHDIIVSTTYQNDVHIQDSIYQRIKDTT